MKAYSHQENLPFKSHERTIEHTLQALLELSITPRRKSGGRVVNMKVDLSLSQFAEPRCPPSCTFESFSGSDHQLRSLQRSKSVYSSDVFNHSIAARSSQPSHVSSSQSFTEKAAVWISKQIIPLPSRRNFSDRGRLSAADLPHEKSRQLPIPWSSTQPSPEEVMQDLFQSSDRQQQGEYDSQEESRLPWTDVNWVELCDQHPAATLPQSDLLHYVETNGMEQAIPQSQLHNQYFNNPWSPPTRNVTFPSGDDQDTLGRPDANALSDSNAVPLPSLPSSQPYTFPLTPPSSTPSNGASPNNEAAGGYADALNNASQLGVDLITSSIGILPIQGAALTAPSTPQDLPPELTFSNEEFAQLFETDPFLADLTSVEQTSGNQALLDIGWHQETLAATKSTEGPYTQPQQGQWHSHASNQPTHLSSYPSFTFDPLDGVNPFPHSAGVTQNMAIHEMASSFHTENPATISSMFDDLSPDVDPPAVGRRNGVKGHQQASAKDRQLIEWKNQGLSYREIKARGGFDEAESTLRGRYRTLTKPKHLRVRKPEWQPRDVEILLEAVDYHSQDHTEEYNVREPYLTEAQRRASKIPWKQVAEYMEKRGCYRYGNATVKKKYLKVMANSFDL